MPLAAAAAARALPAAAPTAAAPFVLARWCPPRRDRRSTMRAAAGALARLTAGALSNPMAKALSASSASASASAPAIAVTRPRPLSSSRGPGRRRGLPSSLEAPAASVSSSSSAASRESEGGGNAQREDRSGGGGGDLKRTSFSFVAASERGTARLAALLSSGRKPGDVLLLYGDVGAGKSAFARAFVRRAARDGELPVPSPTFLLHNVYDDGVVADRGRVILALFFFFSLSLFRTLPPSPECVVSPHRIQSNERFKNETKKCRPHNPPL